MKKFILLTLGLSIMAAAPIAYSFTMPQRKCSSCNGTGISPGTGYSCLMCKGSGRI